MSKPIVYQEAKSDIFRLTVTTSEVRIKIPNHEKASSELRDRVVTFFRETANRLVETEVTMRGGIPASFAEKCPILHITMQNDSKTLSTTFSENDNV